VWGEEGAKKKGGLFEERFIRVTVLLRRGTSWKERSFGISPNGATTFAGELRALRLFLGEKLRRVLPGDLYRETYISTMNERGGEGHPGS